MCAFDSKQPDRLFSQIVGNSFEVCPVEQHRSCGEWIAQMLATITLAIEDSSAVVIPETGNRARFVQATKSIQHVFDGPIELARNGNSVQLGENAGMEKEIKRLDMIIKRLLKVHAIRAHLAHCFALDDLPSSLLPALRRSRSRTQRANEEQSHCFTQQVRIRRKIGRKKSLDVARILHQCSPKIRRKRLRNFG
jgi:hypothetical protein